MTYLGASFLIFLGIIRAAAMVENGMFSLIGSLLVVQSLLAGLLLVLRRKASSRSPWSVSLLAWMSALLPLAMEAPLSTSILALLPVPGMVLMLWSLACLGQAFGISPAHRGLVMCGPYRTIRHPMYAGELLSLAGTLAAFPGWRNLVILCVFLVSVLWRISQEEKILRSGQNGYSHYADHVEWRLIPGIW